MVISISLHAQERVGIGHYMQNSVTSGQTVCEPGEPGSGAGVCYIVTDFSKVLNLESDITGYMAAGSMSIEQGAFVEIELKQLISTVGKTEYKNAQIFNIYLKLKWQGFRESGYLNIGLDDEFIIKSQVLRDAESGELKVGIVQVPEMYLMNMFMPEISIAEMFGRNAMTESFELSQELKLWAYLIITPHLLEYFNQDHIIINQP